MSVRVVEMRDDGDDVRWAAGLHDLGAGVVALVAPAGVESLGRALLALGARLGKSAEENPLQVAQAQLQREMRAWLVGMRVRRVVLVRGDWLPRPVMGALVAFLDGSGVDVDCLLAPGGPRAPGARPAGATSWARFVEEEAGRRSAAGAREPDRERTQSDPIEVPAWAPGGPVGADGPLDAIGLAACAQLAAAIGRDGRTGPAATRATAQVLRSVGPEDLAAATRGCARALALAGYDLRAATDPAPAPRPPWAALRASISTLGPATAAALAAGLVPAELRDLRVGDVADDGSSVSGPEGSLPVPPGARAYIRAHLVLRALEGATDSSPFLARQGRPLTPRYIADTVAATLAPAGISVSGRDLVAPRSPSERWLAVRGLAVHRSPERPVAVRKVPICRHGLPAELRVDGVLVSHSRGLCLRRPIGGDVPASVRPESHGFERTLVRDCELGQAIEVRMLGRYHSVLVGLATPRGMVWCQVTGYRQAPSLEAIVAAVRRDHPGALGPA